MGLGRVSGLSGVRSGGGWLAGEVEGPAAKERAGPALGEVHVHDPVCVRVRVCACVCLVWGGGSARGSAGAVQQRVSPTELCRERDFTCVVVVHIAKQTHLECRKRIPSALRV